MTFLMYCRSVQTREVVYNPSESQILFINFENGFFFFFNIVCVIVLQPGLTGRPGTGTRLTWRVDSVTRQDPVKNLVATR